MPNYLLIQDEARLALISVTGPMKDDPKLYNPQPHVPPGVMREKLDLAEMYVALTRAMMDMSVPNSDLETMLVLLIVFIGDAEGRTTTATKIAAHSRIPRSNVYRRLNELINLKKIVRVGRNYRLAEGAATVDEHKRLMRILDKFCQKRASNMDTL